MDAKSEFLNSAIAESHWEKKSIEKLLINGSDECIYAIYSGVQKSLPSVFHLFKNQ